MYVTPGCLSIPTHGDYEAWFVLATMKKHAVVVLTCRSGRIAHLGLWMIDAQQEFVVGDKSKRHV
jgi:hypothetical protein